MFVYSSISLILTKPFYYKQKMSVPPVLLVTIKFKKRGLMPNEFTVRLASTDFGDSFTVKQLIDQGYKKLISNSLNGRNFFATIPQRLLGYGKYIGYNSDGVITVYTEKDKGRISLEDVARNVLINNETIVVEYHDRKINGYIFNVICAILIILIVFYVVICYHPLFVVIMYFFCIYILYLYKKGIYSAHQPHIDLDRINHRG